MPSISKPGADVLPGETPPDEAGTEAETGPRDKPKPGCYKVPTILIAFVVALCVTFFVAYAVITAR